MIKPTYGYLLVRLVTDERLGVENDTPRGLVRHEEPLACGEIVMGSQISETYWPYPRGSKVFFERHAVAIVPPMTERLVIISEASVLAWSAPPGWKDSDE